MPARPDPDVKIWLSKGLNPSLYVIFHGDFEKNIRKAYLQANEGL